MYTEATQQALQGLRDLSSIQWYIIPLLAIILYIYVTEIKKAKQNGNWNAVFAGLTLFGMVLFNETWNGWVFHFSQWSAVWTAPGPTALRTMVGANIEIWFMFTIAGIVWYNTIEEDRKVKIFGIPNWWFWAIVYSAFCVFIECLLNIGGHLIWEYPWWDRTFQGIWLIFLIGYFHFYVAMIIVCGMKTNRNKVIAVSAIYAVPIIMNFIAFGIFDWVY
jgi:hypothetical protein